VSTWRLTSLRGATNPTGSSTWRLTSLRGGGTALSVILVTLNGPTTAEPNETVTITAVVTGGTPSTYSFNQTTGVTVALTGTGASRTFVAPALPDGTILTFEVTVTRAGAADATASLEIDVWAAAEYILTSTGWEPRIAYIFS
jgi:hypothetical protein